MSIKLHLGCGDIYLQDFVNIDVAGKLESEVLFTELVKNMTTLDTYFKYPFGTARRDVIVDKKMDLLKSWDYKNESVQQIIMVSCLEHFTRSEALFIISEMQRVLRPEGSCIISVPNIAKQMELYYESDPEWCMTLIYCNGKNEYSLHRWGYTDSMFRALWGEEYEVQCCSLIEHAYPMLQYKIIKRSTSGG